MDKDEQHMNFLRRQTTKQDPWKGDHPFTTDGRFTKLDKKFSSLDHDETYIAAAEHIKDPYAKNLVVDYGPDRAFCALDVGEEELEELSYDRPKELDSRWIAIFGPHRQPELVAKLADMFQLSQRHKTILLDKPRNPKEYNEKKGIRGYYDIVNRVYHWHAVELGGKFIAIGYNSLYDIPLTEEQEREQEKKRRAQEKLTAKQRRKQEAEEEERFSRNNTVYPDGTRSWTWIILTSNGTIISLHETLFKDEDCDVNEYARRVEFTRRNISDILRSLSVSNAAMDSQLSLLKEGGIQAMNSFPFRTRNFKEQNDAAFAGPGLLFYYLFDDWESSCRLAIERRHPYGRMMAEIRRDLLRNPGLKQIGDLYEIARKLNVLKRMYETYNVIIDRILHKYENASVTQRMENDDNPEIPTEEGEAGSSSVLGVPLHPEANKRFERLQDRINLYALAEIQDLLEEQKGLVDMALNLMTLNQGKSVDRLTRVALLLAKATIFFLPIQFVIAYFSTSVSDFDNVYTKYDVWGTCAVTLALTIIFLTALSTYTGTAELGGVLYNLKDWLRKAKNKKEDWEEEREERRARASMHDTRLELEAYGKRESTSV